MFSPGYSSIFNFEFVKNSSRSGFFLGFYKCINISFAIKSIDAVCIYGNLAIWMEWGWVQNEDRRPKTQKRRPRQNRFEIT